MKMEGPQDSQKKKKNFLKETKAGKLTILNICFKSIKAKQCDGGVNIHK